MIDVECCYTDILEKIDDVISNRIDRTYYNPYYKENSAEIAMSSIISFLDWISDNKNRIKKFYDIPKVTTLINS